MPRSSRTPSALPSVALALALVACGSWALEHPAGSTSSGPATLSAAPASVTGSDIPSFESLLAGVTAPMSPWPTTAPAPVVAAPVAAAPAPVAPVAPVPVPPVVPAPVATTAPAPVVAKPVAPAPVVAKPVAPAPVVAKPAVPAPVVAKPVAPAPAPAGGGIQTNLDIFETRLAQDINNARSAAGVGTLTVVTGYTDVSRAWAQHLASVNSLSHNPNGTAQMQTHGGGSWTSLAENVGYLTVTTITPSSLSAAADSLFNSYMNSPGHKANILAASSHYLGIGAWASQSGGTYSIWNAQNFCDTYAGYGAAQTSPWNDKAFSGPTA